MDDDFRYVAEGEDERPVKKYPHAREVFELFGKYPLFWRVNRLHLQAAEDLYVMRGITELTEQMAWYKKNRKREFCPQFDNPVEWANKYEAIDRFFDKLNS